MDKKTTNNLVLLAIGTGVAYYLYTMYAVSKGFGSSKDTTINDYVPSSSKNGSTETATATEKLTDKPINQNDSYNMRVFWVRKKWGLNTEDSKAVVDQADSIVSNPDSDWAQSIQAKATERGNSFYQQAINDAYWILFGPGSEAGIQYVQPNYTGEGSVVYEGGSINSDNIVIDSDNSIIDSDNIVNNEPTTAECGYVVANNGAHWYTNWLTFCPASNPNCTPDVSAENNYIGSFANPACCPTGQGYVVDYSVQTFADQGLFPCSCQNSSCYQPSGNAGSGGPAPGGDSYMDYEEMMDADMLASGDWVMMGINGQTNFVG